MKITEEHLQKTIKSYDCLNHLRLERMANEKLYRVSAFNTSLFIGNAQQVFIFLTGFEMGTRYGS